MHTHSNLVEPRSLVSTGEHGLYYSIVGIHPTDKGLIVSGNTAEFKSLNVHTCVHS